MMLPIGMYLVALVGGLALGLSTRRRSPWWVPVRSFAVAAVVSTVFFQLLPEALSGLGVWTLPVLLAALVLPSWLGRRGGHAHGHEPGASSHQWGAELAFVGFVIHQAAESLALGSYVGSLVDDAPPWGLLIALGAHTLPLTAVFVAEAISHAGVAAAWRRVAVLVGVTVLGCALGQSFGQLVQGAHPVLSAVVAGFLAHVVTHSHHDDGTRPVALGLFDAMAIMLGLGLPLVLELALEGAHGDHGHAHAHGPVDELREFVILQWGRFVRLGAAPLVLGWGVALGLLHTRARAWVGRGVPETIALLVFWLGGWTGLAYALASAFIAVLGQRSLPSERPRMVSEDGLAALRRRVRETVPWLLLGTYLAAVGMALGPRGGAWLAALAFAAGLPTVALVPVAAMLVAHGIGLGWVFAGLLVAPHLRWAVLREVRAGSGAVRGRWMAGIGAAALVGAVVGAALDGASAAWLPGWRDGVLQRAGVAVVIAAVFSEMVLVGFHPWMRALSGADARE